MKERIKYKIALTQIHDCNTWMVSNFHLDIKMVYTLVKGHLKIIIITKQETIIKCFIKYLNFE